MTATISKVGFSVRKRVVDIRNSPGVSATRAFEEWEGALSELYFPVSATPVCAGESVAGKGFHASIDYTAFDGLELTVTHGPEQKVRRAKRHIAQLEAPCLLAAIGVAGRDVIEQGEWSLGPLPGQLYLMDGSRPYTAVFGRPFTQVHLQVPWTRIEAITGLEPDRIRTGVPMPIDGVTTIVSRFFRDLAQLAPTDPVGASQLAEHGIGLLAATVLRSTGRAPDGQPARALARQRVLTFMRHQHTDPGLTVEQIALGCALSRTALYRLFDESTGGVAAVLRGMRVDHARTVLRTTDHTQAAVATASGFGSERNFYRAFKEGEGMSPGEYRERWTTAVSMEQVGSDLARRVGES